ncbi:MAG: 23S rRNA (pseudouridine(1915)-N(3))-methyltransferase RlmH [Patescibacteria group bacterium]|jgi:23S rRNA (pseudouridine1915-N3)-methyltransferase
MLNLTLITVGSLKEPALKTLASQYQKRLSPYARLKIIELPAFPFSEQEGSRKKSQEKLKASLETVLSSYPKENVYLLSEHGRLYDTSGFTELCSRPLVLVIAGALGWPDSFTKDYQCLSLSPLTMPHELARVVLLEQLYRAATIKANKTYHY